MAKLLAQAQITITSVNDGYTVVLAPSSVTIPSNTDGTNAVLDSAKTRVILTRGGSVVPITITSLTPTGCTASFVNDIVSITSIPTATDNGQIVINFKSTDNNYVGSATFNFAKVKQGVDGQDGQDAYTVSLDNESHTVPATFDGIVTQEELDKAMSNIRVWKGITQLTAVGAGVTPTLGEYRYVISTTIGGTSVRINNTSFKLATITADSAQIRISVLVENRQTIEKVMTIVKSKAGISGGQGIAGPAITGRGVYSNTSTYYGSTTRVDVVKYNATWYKAKSNAGTFDGIPPSGHAQSSAKWEAFGADFKSVATDLLFADDAFIGSLGTPDLYVGNADKTRGWKLGQESIESVQNTGGIPKVKLTSSGDLEVVGGSLKILSGGNSQTISQYTEEKANTAINNLQLGGVNLLSDSHFDETDGGWVMSSYVTSSVADSIATFTVINSQAATRLEKLINLKAGVYTLTLFAKAQYGISFSTFINANILFPTTRIGGSTNFKKYTVTFEVIADGNVTIRPYLGSNYAVGSTVEVEWVKLEAGNKASDWSPSVGDVDDLIDKAQTDATTAINSAATANTAITDMVSDGKLTPVEKGNIKILWDEVVKEYPKILAQATSYTGVQTTGYTSSYNTLNNSIPTLLVNMSVTSTVNTVTIRTNFANYYEQKASLLQAIVTATKSYSDGVLDDAKQDATNKDNALKTELETYADSSATSAANIAAASALSDAKTYAESQATTAQSNAEAAASDLVNAIKIGAVNLHKDSYLTRPDRYGGTFSITPSTPTNILHYDKSGATNFGYQPGSYVKDGITYDDRTTSVVAGKEYTLSYELRGNITAMNYSYLMRMDGTNSGILSISELGLSETTFQHYSKTFIAPWSSDQAYVMISTSSGGADAWFEIRNIKLEEGNKATAWSPSHNDVDMLIAEAKKTADDAKQANTDLTNSLKGMAYKDVVEYAELGNTVVTGGKILTNLLDVDYIRGNVIKAEYINALDIEASSIRIGSGAEDFINDKIEAIQIGGRNLALNTSFKLNPEVFVAGTQVINNGEITVTQTGSAHYGFALKFSQFLEANEDYILSLQIKTTNATPFNYISLRINVGETGYGSASTVYSLGNITTDGKYHQYTLPVSTNLTTINGISIATNGQGTSFSVKDVKIEKGNKATAWSPAPEDIEGYLDGAFKDGLIEENEAISIKKYLNVIINEQSAYHSRYFRVYSNPALVGTTEKSNLNTAYNDYNAAFNTLSALIQNVVSNGRATPQEITDVNDTYNSYTQYLKILITRIELAVDAIATNKATAAETAAISAASTDATNKAAAAVTTANEASQTLVNSLQIGAVNLLDNTKNFNDPANIGWTNYQSTTISVENGNLKLIGASVNNPRALNASYVQLQDTNTDYIATVYYTSDNPISLGGKTYKVGAGEVRSFNFTRIEDIEDGSWYKSTFKWTAKKENDDNFRIYLILSQNQTAVINWVKLEIGNKATDWSPSVGDVNKLISTAEKAGTDAQAAHDALKGELVEMDYETMLSYARQGKTIIEGGYINTTMLDVETIQSTIVTAGYINALEIEASKIKVGSDADSYIKNKIGDIEIGGRNLWRNSSNLKYNTGSGSPTVSVVTDGNEVNVIKVVNPGSYFNIHGSDLLYDELNVGEEFTVSFLMRGIPKSTSKKVSVYFNNNSGGYQDLNKDIETTYTWASATYVCTTNTIPSVHFGATDFSEIYVSRIKVEKGNKATAWSPAAEDIFIGQRNVLLQSNKSMNRPSTETTYLMGRYDVTSGHNGGSLKIGTEYTLIVKGSNSGVGALGVWINGSQRISDSLISNETDAIKIIHFVPTDQTSRTQLSFYHYPSGSAGESKVDWAAVYEGRVVGPLDWLPSPEDTEQIVLETEIGTTNYFPSHPSKWEKGHYMVEDGSDNTIQRTRLIGYVDAEPNQKYTLSIQGDPAVTNVAYYEYTSNNSHIITNSGAGWNTLTYPHTFTTTPTTSKFRFVIDMTTGLVTDVPSYKIKLEKGVKVTSWSPTPEDTIATALELTDSATDSKLSTFRGSVLLEAKQEAEGLADAAQSNAEAAAEALVNSIEIGATNLLDDSEAEWSTTAFASASAYGVYRNDDTMTTLYESLLGKVFTVSLDIKIEQTDTTPKRVRLYGSNSNPKYRINTHYINGVTTDWKRFSVQSTIDDLTATNSNESRLEFYGEVPEVTKIYVRKIKFELGDKATSWSPSINDVNDLIATAEKAGTDAQAAHNALKDELIEMDYESIVEVARQGKTIIDGGYINTTLLKAEAIQSTIINADYINGLEIEATKLKIGGGVKTVEGALRETLNTVNTRNYLPIRYVRDFLSGSDANGGNHWVELEVWNYKGVNVALSKPVSTDGTNFTNPTRLVDGNRTATAYVSGDNMGGVGETSTVWQYAQVDLGSIMEDIERINVVHYYTDGRKYHTKLEVSSDGSNWVSLFNSDEEGRYAETAEGKDYYVNTGHISSLKTLDGAKNYTDIVPLGGGTGKIFNKPVTFGTPSSTSTTGAILIKTPITNPYMIKMRVTGYTYGSSGSVSGADTGNLDITFNIYTASATSISKATYTSNGNFPIEKIYVGKYDGKTVICIGELDSVWNRQTVTVEYAEVSFSNPPDSFAQGWGIEFITSYNGKIANLFEATGFDIKADSNNIYTKTGINALEDGETIIEGGYINTTLLHAEEVQAKIVTSDAIEALTIDASKITIGGTSVKNYVDSIEVGGTNLLQDSYLKRWVRYTSATEATITEGSPTQTIKAVRVSGSVLGVVNGGNDRKIKTKIGETYTLSYEAKGNVPIQYVYLMHNDGDINNQAFGGVSQLSDTEFKKFTHQITAVRESDVTYVLIASSIAVAGSQFEVRNIKLEKGNKATDWSPNPYDVTDDINAVQSNLDNMEIGGRNYAWGLGGGIYDSARIYSGDKNNFEEKTVAGKLWLRCKIIGNTFRLTAIPVVGGETYTWSFDAFTESGNAVLTFRNYDGGSYANDQYNITVTKKRFYHTFTARAGATYDIPHISGFSVGTHIADFKLEKGNKGSNYTPATEDLERYTNTKVSDLQNSLGDLALLDKIDAAKLDSTVIEGGYLKNSLISTDYIQTLELFANNIKISNEVDAKNLVEVTDDLDNKANKIESDTQRRNYAAGKLLNRDVTFKEGNNDISRYENGSANNNAVTRVTASSDNPTSSTHMIRMRNIGATTPGYGGFVHSVVGRQNTRLLQRFIAKVPVNYRLEDASNTLGSGGKTTWLTSNIGTGKWEEYIVERQCGTGTISSTGHIYLNGPTPGTSANPLDWYLAWYGTYDMTDAEVDYKALADGAYEYAEAGENILPYSNDFVSTFNGSQGSEVTFTDNIKVDEWGATDATRVVTAGGSAPYKVLRGIPGHMPSINGQTYTLSIWVKNEGSKDIELHSNNSTKVTIPAGANGRYSQTCIGNGQSHLQFQFRTLSLSDSINMVLWRAKVEYGDKTTIWVPHNDDLSNNHPQGFRYVRDWLNGSTANATNHWIEIQVLNTLGVNIARGLPVTSNTTNISNPQLLTDGNTATTPYASTSTSEAYVELDFGRVIGNVDRIHVWHYYGDGRKYNTKLEVSRDGVIWTKLFDSNIDGTYNETSEGKIHYINPSKQLEMVRSNLKTSFEVLEGSIKSQVSAVYSIPDTRTTDESPSWYITYYKQRSIEEFKDKSTLDLDTAVTSTNRTLGTLVTTVPWNDITGGVTQEFKIGTQVFTRYAQNTTTWSTWVELENPLSVQGKIDNIKVGGRNYALGSSNTLRAVNIGPYNVGFPNRYVRFDHMGVGLFDEVTMSAYLKVPANAPDNARLRLDVYDDGSSYTAIAYSNSILKGTEGIATLTYKISTNTFNTYTRFSLLLSRDNATSTSPTFGIEYKNLKFEVGNKATDWSPAPEDIRTYVDGEVTADYLAQHIPTLQAEQAALTSRYYPIYNHTEATPTTQSQVQNVKTAYNTAYNNLVSKLTSIRDSNTVTAQDRSTLNTLFSTYRTAVVNLEEVYANQTADLALLKAEGSSKLVTKEAYNTYVTQTDLAISQRATLTQFNNLNDLVGQHTTYIEQNPQAIELSAKSTINSVRDKFFNLIGNPAMGAPLSRWASSTGIGSTTTITNVDFFGQSTPVITSRTSSTAYIYSDFFEIDISKAYQIDLWLKNSIRHANTYIGAHTYSGTFNGDDEWVASDNVSLAGGISDIDGSTSAGSTNMYFWRDAPAEILEWTHFTFYLLPNGFDRLKAIGLGNYPNVATYNQHLVMGQGADFARLRVLNYSNSQERTIWMAHPKVTEVDSNLLGRFSSAQASIKVNADEITSMVKKGDIASTINQTAQSVTIDASKINLKGAISITSFDNATVGLLGNDSSTHLLNYNFLDWRKNNQDEYISEAQSWGFSGSGSSYRITGSDSIGNAVRFNFTSNSLSGYISQANSTPYQPYTYVECKVRLSAGSLNGSGINIRSLVSSGTYTEVQIPFKDLIPSPVLGEWYVIKKVIKNDKPSNYSGIQTFIFGNWSYASFGGMTSKTLDIDYIKVREASDEEVYSAFTAPAKFKIDVLSSSYKRFKDLAGVTYGSGTTGMVVIRTPITSAFMCRIKVNGFNYVDTKSNIDVIINLYAYQPNQVIGYGYTSTGSFKITDVDAYRDSSGRLVLVLQDTYDTTPNPDIPIQSWSYPKFNVEYAEISHHTPPDSFADGWSIEVVTSLPSGLTNKTEITETGLQGTVDTTKKTADATKTLTDGWAYPNTTKIDGGSIQTNTITANAIASKTITANEIKAGTITAEQIAADTITSAKMATNSIKISSLAPDTKGLIGNMSGDSINVNPYFLDWDVDTNGNYSSYPVGFSSASLSSGSSVSRIQSNNTSGNAIRFTVAGNGHNAYLNPVRKSDMTFHEYVVVEATFRLVSGTVNGAGILFRYNGSGNTDHHMPFHSNNFPNVELGKWYTFTKTIHQSSEPSGFESYSVFVMGAWTSFTSTTAKVIDFDMVRARPATDQEINAYVTGDIVSNWSYSGTTEINGAKIRTGTIEADQIKVGTITTDKLVINSANMIYDFDSFEQIPVDTVLGYNGSLSSARVSDEEAFHGTKSFKIVTNNSNSYTYLAADGTTNNAGWLKLKKGSNYILSLYAKTTTASVNAHLYANIREGRTTTLISGYSSGNDNVTPAKGWTRYSVLIDNVGGTNPHLSFYFRTVSPAVCTVYLDGIQLEEVPAGVTKPSQFSPGGTNTLNGEYIQSQTINADSIITNTLTALGNVTAGSFNIGSGKFKVTTAGVLSATGADISGKITATSGSFSGTVTANSGTIGGLVLSSSSIKSSNNAFSVTSSGVLTATNATITGTVTATSGSFTGAITATSLTIDDNGTNRSIESFVDGKVYEVEKQVGNLVNNPVITGDESRWTNHSELSVVNETFFGVSTKVFKVTTTGDRQIVSDYIKVDPTKAYKVSMWFKSTQGSSGSTYLGTNSYNIGESSIPVTRVSDTTGTVTHNADTNFYFWSTSSVSTLSDWYEVVAYVLPSGFSPGNAKGLSVNASSHMIMRPDQAYLRVRFLNYYNSGNTRTVWVAHPSVTEVDPFSLLNINLTNSWKFTGTTQIDGGNIKADTITAIGYVQAGSFSLGNGNFSVTNGGVLTAKSGTIGGVTITSNTLTSSGGKFKIKSDGSLEATGAKISGEITAESGTIGGLSISANKITGNSFTLEDSGLTVVKGNFSAIEMIGGGYIRYGEPWENYNNFMSISPETAIYRQQGSSTSYLREIIIGYSYFLSNDNIELRVKNTIPYSSGYSNSRYRNIGIYTTADNSNENIALYTDKGAVYIGQAVNVSTNTLSTGGYIKYVTVNNFGGLSQARVLVFGNDPADWVNPIAPTVYYNTMSYADWFQTQNCFEPKPYGQWVYYSVPAGSVSSTISVSDANTKASNKCYVQGQANANLYGGCSAEQGPIPIE